MSFENVAETLENAELPIQQRLRPILREPRLIVNQQPAVEMAQQQFYPPGFHPSLLSNIGEYDGNPLTLAKWLRQTGTIIEQFSTPNQGDYINHLLLSTALSRLTGAAETATLGQTINTWTDLKNKLKVCFGDNRSEDTLLQELMNLYQRNETSLEFYDKCMKSRTSLLTHLTLTEQDQGIIQTKANLYTSLTKNQFITGLRGDLSRYLRSRNPTTMEDALKIVLEEKDIEERRSRLPLQKNQQFVPTRLQTNSQKLPYQLPRQFQPAQNHPIARPKYVPTYRLPNIPPMNFPGHQFPNNPNWFNPQQYKPRGPNVFKPGTNIPTNRPTPMQTSTVQKRPATQQLQNSTRRPFQQSNAPRNFMSQELFNNSIDEIEPPVEKIYPHETNDASPENDYNDFDMQQQLCEQFDQQWQQTEQEQLVFDEMTEQINDELLNFPLPASDSKTLP